MILNTLVYDGKAEKIVTNDRVNMYRAVEPLLNFPGLIGSPCGVCPVSIKNKEYIWNTKYLKFSNKFTVNISFILGQRKLLRRRRNHATKMFIFLTMAGILSSILFRFLNFLLLVNLHKEYIFFILMTYYFLD